jgi:hypothetical protein
MTLAGYLRSQSGSKRRQQPVMVTNVPACCAKSLVHFVLDRMKSARCRALYCKGSWSGDADKEDMLRNKLRGCVGTHAC